MEYHNIMRKIDDVFDYFRYHNKNLTKTQEWKLQELQDLISALKELKEEEV